MLRTGVPILTICMSYVIWYDILIWHVFFARSCLLGSQWLHLC